MVVARDGSMVTATRVATLAAVAGELASSASTRSTDAWGASGTIRGRTAAARALGGAGVVSTVTATWATRGA